MCVCLLWGGGICKCIILANVGKVLHEGERVTTTPIPIFFKRRISFFCSDKRPIVRTALPRPSSVKIRFIPSQDFPFPFSHLCPQFCSSPNPCPLILPLPSSHSHSTNRTHTHNITNSHHLTTTHIMRMRRRRWESRFSPWLWILEF